MILPDGLLLRKVTIQNVYFDKKSYEKSTGLTKPKYKLAGNPLNKVYTFFITTTNSDACHRKSTVIVKKCHWENKVDNHLNAPESFIDVKKVEVLTSDEVLIKIKDLDNKFILTAKLCDSKFSELKSIREDAHKKCGNISIECLALVDVALRDIVDTSSICDEILINLGLN